MGSDQVISEAVKVWKRMEDRDDREVGMTPDGECEGWVIGGIVWSSVFPCRIPETLPAQQTNT